MFGKRIRDLILYVNLLMLTPILLAQDIHEAVRGGDLNVVKALLDENPTFLELRSAENLTPLILASIEGHAEIASYLLDRHVARGAGNRLAEAPQQVL